MVALRVGFLEGLLKFEKSLSLCREGDLRLG
jgi:hypothetical protein